ncbi:DUF6415 family natural product biosynthesis protein [Streptomyces flaveus]|uniref:DUF6415 family natural product biosynthesis protein n=1 Tax=Streptomyces flaveus TaxID=66370 RepID=UPI0033309127
MLPASAAGAAVTTAAAVSWRSSPVEKWSPPLSTEALADVLQKVRQWQPFDCGALLDDVAVVLDDVLPPEDLLDESAQRLRGHLMQLIDIAVAAEADEDEEASRLIERARAVRSEDMPGDHRHAVGHLRRMAWTVNELLERLVATQCLREAA